MAGIFQDVGHAGIIPTMATKRYAILKIESFEGRDTYLRCGDENQDFLFAVLLVDDVGNTEILDSGYRTYEEALKAWPEAKLLEIHGS